MASPNDSPRDAAELEAMIRSRDEVMAVVAHDLQNPLNVISLAASTLLKRATDPALRRPVERILGAVQRADRLVRDLVDIGAIERGRLTIRPLPLDPADLILAAIDSQQSAAGQASILIATDISPDLPPILADEERLHEVLENLIGNALKFTGPGGTITVGASTGNGEVIMWVEDSGAGIAPDELPHVFDRFWQARKADRRGTGLGLTITKAIVESHGGRIWLDSRLGQGTTARFTIPASVDPSASKDPAIATLLLVDDRPENLTALTAILDRPEYRLVTASSGEEALKLALRQQFDVALIDVAMPGMNGLDVAAHLKQLERSRETPVIFITAYGDDPEQIHRAYAAGGADYLIKPLDAEIVRKKVAVFVGLSRRGRHTHPNLKRSEVK
jgi:CheY-like chemotaxis protein/anti-sigma regulatory factor (Ser/Thr protein kinase)